MNGLFSWLANLLRMKPMQPGESDIPPGGPDVTDDGRTAPIVPPKPSGKLITGLPSNGNAAGTSTPRAHSAELDGLNKDYAAERDILLKSPEKAQIDPTESLISGLTGLFTKNATARDRTFGAPSALADNRAAVANQELQQQQHNAGVAMGHTGSLINAYLDRDSQSDKINEMIASATQKDATRRMLAGWRNNTQLTASLAKLEGNGGITPQGLAAVLQQEAQNQGIDLNDEDAMSHAIEMIKGFRQSDITKIQLQAQADKDKATGTNQLKELDQRQRGATTAHDFFQVALDRFRLQNGGQDPDPDTEQKMLANAESRGKLATSAAQGKVDLMKAHTDEAIARSSEIAKHGSLDDARAAAERVKSHLPATPQEAAAVKAIADANEALWKVKHPDKPAKGDKGVTATARYNAENQISRAQGHADAMIAQYQGYQDEFNKLANDYAKGARKVMDKNGEVVTDGDQIAAKVHEAQDQAASAGVVLIRWQREKAHLDDRLKGLATPNAPVTLSGEIKMPPGWSVGH